jgi:hypothetical protein
MAEIECLIPRVLSHTHNFEFTACFRLPAEVLANWVFVFEKLPRKRLIDDLSLARMLSGANAFEISDIQEDEIRPR